MQYTINNYIKRGHPHNASNNNPLITIEINILRLKLHIIDLDHQGSLEERQTTKRWHKDFYPGKPKWEKTQQPSYRDNNS